jgi:hypothetical protein
VFHQFRQAKIVFGGSILSSTIILLLPQLPQKNGACIKNGQNEMVKIILIPWSKSGKLTVEVLP